MDDQSNATGNPLPIVIALIAGGAIFLWISGKYYGATAQAIAAPGGALIGLAFLIVALWVIRWIANCRK